ncbi:hypothetical protein B0H13DRAFT_2448123 [Mycena leptocephala]|nr:hypothetical protein B0H13DRAFT_2448123 [Mycena leptocephala]
MSQSYGQYAPSGTQTPPAASTTYPYGYPTAYPPHTPYAQTPGAYPYPTAGGYQYAYMKSSTFSSYTPSHLRESVAAAATGGATGRVSRKQPSVRGLFTKELKNLMYGFGDDRNPATDTVNCQTAGAQTKRVRLSIEDLRRALSRPADAKKFARMEELLFMQEDIKRARAQFDEEVHREN